jgi:hypothetical protein
MKIKFNERGKEYMFTNVEIISTDKVTITIVFHYKKDDIVLDMQKIEWIEITED